MKFKYCGTDDWMREIYENCTFTFLQISDKYVYVVSDENGRICRFDTYELQRITKLEEAMK